MNNQKQNDTPPIIRWLYRRLSRSLGWVILIGILTILYLFVRGFMRSKGM